MTYDKSTKFHTRLHAATVHNTAVRARRLRWLTAIVVMLVAGLAAMSCSSADDSYESGSPTAEMDTASRAPSATVDDWPEAGQPSAAYDDYEEEMDWGEPDPADDYYDDEWAESEALVEAMADAQAAAADAAAAAAAAESALSASSDSYFDDSYEAQAEIQALQEQLDAAQAAAEAAAQAASQASAAADAAAVEYEEWEASIEPPLVHEYEPLRPCRQCDSNIFEDYGVNPFVQTLRDPLSTFGLDVDTASYVVARNYLQGGQAPPFQAVRVEEFVNYFDGGYRTVLNEFNITMDSAPSPFSDEDRVMLRVGVQAPELLSDMVIPDSIVLVVDRSGSMGEPAGSASRYMERIDLVHTAVELLVEGLPRETRVGVVAYDDRAVTILDPTRVRENAAWIVETIRREVYPDGSTNTEAGLSRGYDMALDEARQGRSVLVMLLSDGVANVGATRTDEILESIGERADIGLSTIGVGLGPFNDELMEQLANTADGTYHYIDTPEEAQRVFVDNLTGMLASVARDAKIQVEFNPDTVESYRLLGFENRAIADQDFRDDSVDAGEVGAGQSSTALYEVTLDNRTRGNDLIATATLRYRRPQSERITETSERLYRYEVADSFSRADERFQLLVVAAEFAEVLRKSPFVEDTSLSALGRLARRVAEEVRTDDDAWELADLIYAAEGTGVY